MNARIFARTLAALAWLASGCDRGSDCDPTTEACQGFAIRSCEPLRSACDIREATCQREVFRVTACERGQTTATLPDLRVITRAELREEIEAQLAQAKPTPLDRAWDRASKLLGLVPPDQDSDELSADLFVDGVAAYYSRIDKAITIIEDSIVGSDVDEEDGTFVLSHEYVHALQDQRESLRDFYAAHYSHTDSLAALDSLIEGEATLLSNFVMARANGWEPEDLEFDRYFDDMLLGTLQDLNQNEAPLMAALEILPYPVGGQGLWRTYLQGGSRGLEALYTEPIVTLAQWLAPEATQQALTCGAPVAPNGHALVIADQLGVTGLLALEVVLGEGTDALLDRPVRWTSDLLTVFATEGEDPESVAVAWRMRLHDELDAARLASRVEAQGLTNLSVTQTGQELLLAAIEDPDALASWDLSVCPESKAVPKARSGALLATRLRQRLGWIF